MIMTLERLATDLADEHGRDDVLTLACIRLLASAEGFGPLAGGDTVDDVQVRVLRASYERLV